MAGEPGSMPAPLRRHKFPFPTGAVVAGLIGGLAGAGMVREFGEASSASQTANRVSAVSLVGETSNPTAVVVSKVEPAVVLVKATDSSQTADESTGMIITGSGEVITNNHVIAGATTVSVTLNGSTTPLTATVIGTDATDDAALLQIAGARNLLTVTFADSDNMSIGDRVVAIGYAIGLTGGLTVTHGIISAEGRTITASDTGGGSSETLTGLLQTDAAISSGDSRGPLVNTSGYVVGMDSASAALGSASTAQNIGSAIPSATLESVIARLQKETIT